MIATQALKYKIIEWCIDNIVSGICKNFGSDYINGVSYLNIKEGMFFRRATYTRPGIESETIYNIQILSVKFIPDSIRKKPELSIHIRGYRDPNGKYSDFHLKWSAPYWTFYP
jgi:hypothetical protein